MIQSMTGFGSKEAKIVPLGKICCELRASNHKFLDTLLHLPEGFLALEERIKKEIEARIKRGRVTCNIEIMAQAAPKVFINKGLLENYLAALKKIKARHKIKDQISLDALIHLPGVLSLTENRISLARIWPKLKTLITEALDNLVSMRVKEGRALYIYLKSRSENLKDILEMVKKRFKKVIKVKLAKIKTAEERSSFLKNTDITEEMERLSFHIKNFKNKLLKAGPSGKELDFIAQEMQREANTIGAKSCDALISSHVIQIKSQIEKLREQLQNIE